jgi:RNA polymerase sigma factor (sigma-70 family)
VQNCTAITQFRRSWQVVGATEPARRHALAGLGAGDPQMALAFVRRFQRTAFGVALAIVGDSVLAEDITQQAFERAWRHAGLYDSRRGSVRTWLTRIVHNRAGRRAGPASCARRLDCASRHVPDHQGLRGVWSARRYRPQHPRRGQTDHQQRTHPRHRALRVRTGEVVVSCLPSSATGCEQGRRREDQHNALDDEADNPEWFGPVTDVIGVVG